MSSAKLKAKLKAVREKASRRSAAKKKHDDSDVASLDAFADMTRKRTTKPIITTRKAGKVAKKGKGADKGTKKRARAPPPPASSSSDDDSDDSHGASAPAASFAAAYGPLSSKSSSSSEDEDDSSDSAADGGASVPGFSDHNAQWLKPSSKMHLMGDGESDSSDGDSEPETRFERESRATEAKEAQRAAEAEAEMAEAMQDHERFILPSDEQVEHEKIIPANISVVHQRINGILGVLSRFEDEREPDRSRSDYMEQLRRDLSAYYGYNEFLVDLFMRLFPVHETVEFMEANETPRPITIRVNTLKTRRRDVAAALLARGCNLDELGEWTKVGLQVFESQVPIGATPEYLAGHYMLQGAASFLPVMALAPQPGERVMDMCAAPGGKTTYIAAMMKNTGLLVANDANKDRLKALVGNLHRLGVRNTIVTNYPGQNMADGFGGFDRILLDAPCSGLGVISRDPAIKVQKQISDVHKCAHIQKQLILSAIDALNATSKTGGELVYCTCTCTVEENEAIVQFALENRCVKLVESGLDFGRPGFTKYRQHRFHPNMSMCRRFYPHTSNTDGFFIAKLRKYANALPSGISTARAEVDRKGRKAKAAKLMRDGKMDRSLLWDQGGESGEDEDVDTPMGNDHEAGEGESDGNVASKAHGKQKGDGVAEVSTDADGGITFHHPGRAQATKKGKKGKKHRPTARKGGVTIRVVDSSAAAGEEEDVVVQQQQQHLKQKKKRKQAKQVEKKPKRSASTSSAASQPKKATKRPRTGGKQKGHNASKANKSRTSRKKKE